MSRCDFCSISINGGWAYHTKPLSVIMVPDTPIGMLDDGEWLACDPCAALIEQEKWHELEDRAIGIFMKTNLDMPAHKVQLVIHASHAGFRKNKSKERISNG